VTVPRAWLLGLLFAALVAGDVWQAVGLAVLLAVLFVCRRDPPRWWVGWGGPWRY
jgi:hypothetical protein